MRILPLSTTPPEIIFSTLRQVLDEGGLVLFPTETTYGAGVDATNPLAVQKLLSYKSRREGKPLSIAVSDEAMAEKYALLNEQARAVYKQFLPGPVTVVSTARPTLAPGVASEFGTIGVRIPAYPLLLDFLKEYQKPLTATSANGSGKKRPYAIEDIFSELSEKQKELVDLVLDAGRLPENPPSTVIDTTLSTPVTLRQGEVTIAAASTTDHQLLSQNEAETQAIAGRLLLKHWDDVGKTGLVVGLDGALGAGKTVFAKGVAAFLQISDAVTSPTYTYLEEYEYRRHATTGMFYHLDLWKVDSQAVFERLSLSDLLHPNGILVVEWWSQVAKFFLPLLSEKKVPLIHVGIEEIKDGSSVSTSPASSATPVPTPKTSSTERRLIITEQNL